MRERPWVFVMKAIVIAMTIPSWEELQRLLSIPDQLVRIEETMVQTKQELIDLINQKTESSLAIVLAEQEQVAAVVAELKTEIEDLKEAIEEGRDLSDVVTALETSHATLEEAVSNVYSPAEDPTVPVPEEPTEPTEPPIEPVEPVEPAEPLPEPFENNDPNLI